MTMTKEEVDQIMSAFAAQTARGAQQQRAEMEKQLAWAYASQQQAAQAGLGPSYPKLGRGAADTSLPISAAAQKLYCFISESIGEIGSQWVEIVLVRRELLPKLMNLPRGLPLGAFVGEAGVVVVRFEASNGRSTGKSPDARPPIGPTAVYTIPQSILGELTAEDVAAALDGTSK